MTSPGTMNRYARGASRSQKRALPRGCWTTSGSALRWAVMTLMGYSAAKTIRPVARRRTCESCLAASDEAAWHRGDTRLTPVDALQLRLGLLHGARRVAGLDRLREHVDDDVTGIRFRRLLIGGSGIPFIAAVVRHRRVRRKGRIASVDLQIRVARRHGDDVPALCFQPRNEDFWRVEILEELDRCFGVRRVAHRGHRATAELAELPGWPGWESRVPDIVGLDLDLIIELRLAFLGIHCGQVNAAAVDRRRDLIREECAVVGGIVPGETGLVVRVRPMLGEGLQCLDELRLVDGDGGAVFFNFHRAVAPHEWVGERRWVAETLTESLS